MASRRYELLMRPRLVSVIQLMLAIIASMSGRRDELAGVRCLPHRARDLIPPIFELIQRLIMESKSATLGFKAAAADGEKRTSLHRGRIYGAARQPVSPAQAAWVGWGGDAPGLAASRELSIFAQIRALRPGIETFQTTTRMMEPTSPRALRR